MKRTIHAIVLLTALCAILLVGCTNIATTPDNPPATDSQASETPLSSTLPDTYDVILALRTEGYQNLSVKDFNAIVKAEIDKDIGFLSTFSELMGNLTPEDSEYQFVNETLNYSISEIISPQIGDTISISRYIKNYSGEYTGGDNETFYNFMFIALYSVEYRVTDEANLTVGERDELLRAYQTELQNAVSGMDKEQLIDSGYKIELQKIADDLANDLSTDTLIFENAEIHSIEILDGEQEYQQ